MSNRVSSLKMLLEVSLARDIINPLAMSSMRRNLEAPATDLGKQALVVESSTGGRVQLRGGRPA